MSLRLPIELFEQIEDARGEVKRETWIRGAIEQRLSGGQLRMPIARHNNIGARRPLGEVKQRGDKK